MPVRIVLAVIAATAPIASAAPPDFARDVLPILADRCFACHGPDPAARKADLRLDTPDGFRPAAKDVLARVTSHDTAEVMPPAKGGKPLTLGQIDTLKKWIDGGTAWGKHWAFVAPTRPPVPVLSTQYSVLKPRNPIDHFVRARLEAEGLKPSPEADRVTLIRRLSLDLTGLPPTPAEVDAFFADASPDAYEKVVDRLLASPRYGEHMARTWLDAARYADTHGFFTDHQRYQWRWRDWVIRAFNDNVPFDQFTVEQLAGDLLPDPTVEQRIATGFNRNHPITEETGVIPEEYRAGYVADRVRTTAAVWLGLTAGCAQCHDHKYDPLTQREFYQLFAYFNRVPEKGIDGGQNGNAAPMLRAPTPDQEAAFAALKKLTTDAEAALKAAPAGDARTAADERLKQLQKDKVKLEAAATVMVMADDAKPRDTFVLTRGQYDQPGVRVEPGVPAFLPPLPPGAPPNRLALAKWITDPNHPLTARVAVNRVWQHLFGRGLVGTPEDFGVQGERPTHPELLDWLAVEFAQPADSAHRAWDTKRLVKLIVASATYRQSSRRAAGADPSNRFIARAPRHRLDGEVIRDAALSAGGLLVEKVGGPSVKPYQPAGIWNDVIYDLKNPQLYDQATGDGLYRRSLYTFWKRQLPPPGLSQLDAPTRETCTLRRQRTNTPLQALVLMNDEQFVEAARGVAQRVLAADTDRSRADLAFRLVVARKPDDADAADLLRLVNAERDHYRKHPDAAAKLVRVGASPVPKGTDVAELAAWTVAANALLNTDEAITRE